MDAEIGLLGEIYPHQSTTEIAVMLERSEKSVGKRAYRLGLKKTFEYRSKATSLHQYLINHKYFAKIDSPEKAYWLGIMWSDGCVRKSHGSYHISLEVASKDSELVYQFAKALNTTRPIYRRTSGPNRTSVKLQFASRIMFDDLCQHGVIPRKTYAQLLPDVDEKLISHFVRGLFDGDGCITGKTVQICGSFALCNWLLETTRGLLGVNGGVHKYLPVWWRWGITGKPQAAKFADWIYQDADFYLTRKRQRFDNLKESL